MHELFILSIDSIFLA